MRNLNLDNEKLEKEISQLQKDVERLHEVKEKVRNREIRNRDLGEPERAYLTR